MDRRDETDRRQEEHPELVPEGVERRLNGRERRLPPSRFKSLNRFHDRRRVARYALGGLAVALFLALGFWALATTTGENTRDIQANRRLARVVCVESNKLRDGERGLWELIIQLSAQNPNPDVPKAARDRQLAQFRDYIGKAFAHVDCDAPTAGVGVNGAAPSVSFPVVTRVETNTVTRTRTVFVTVPGGERVRIVCQLPNGRRCP